jgi:hypothetical protein
MSKPKRGSWLDESGESVLIDDYARQLTTFVDALADGVVEAKELDAAERELVALMKDVEPRLDDELHEKVTKLLVHMSALSTMQTLHMIEATRIKSLVL